MIFKSKKSIQLNEPAQKKAADSEVVEFGDFRFYMKRQKRKSIALKSDNSAMFLHIPKQLSARQVSTLLNTHQAWLLKNAQRLQHSIEQEFRALPNSRFHFLGEPCELVYIAKTSNRQPAQYQTLNELERQGKSQLAVPVDLTASQNEQEHQAASAMQKWFVEQSQSYLFEQMAFYSERMQLPYKSLQVKTYKARWGSCYRDGRIQFNWRLLQAPKWVVDYVVVHELAHLRHLNHSKDFWHLVERFYPQTEAAKLSLKKQGAAWINFLQTYQ